MKKSGQEFFDQIAEQWDEFRSLDSAKIESLMQLIGWNERDRILDVGCGTGVLVPFLNSAVGEQGFITSVDFSSKMIERATEKYKKLTGIQFVVSDIMDFESNDKYNKVICFNFFPHVTDKSAFLKKISTLLVTDGCLVIMHDISRDAVNAIHGSCETVKNDRLPEGNEVAILLKESGYLVSDIVDNEDIYFIKAFKK